MQGLSSGNGIEMLPHQACSKAKCYAYMTNYLQSGSGCGYIGDMCACQDLPPVHKVDKVELCVEA